MQRIQNHVKRACRRQSPARLHWAYAAIVLFASAFVPLATAETVTLEPEADTWLSSCPGGWSQKNGTGPTGAYQELRLRGWGYGPRAFRAALRFDLSELSGATIEGAALRIYWHTGHWIPPQTPQTVDVYRMINAWAEGSSNWRYSDDPENPGDPTEGEWNSIDVWNAASPYYSGPDGSAGGGGDYDELVRIASDTLDWTFPGGQESDWESFPGEWIEFDVAEQVQAWIDGDDNHGFLIRLNDELQGGPGMTDVGSTVYQFRSKECEDQTIPCNPAQKPHLEISYSGGESVPTVSTWGMIVMSLLVLVAGTLAFVRRHATTVR